jgi:hypothetical protein
MPSKFSADWFLTGKESRVPRSVQERMDSLFSSIDPRSPEAIKEEFDRDVFSKFARLKESKLSIRSGRDYAPLVVGIHEKAKQLFSEGVEASIIEEGIFDSILNFFQGLGSQTIEAFKEKAIGWVLGLLGLEENTFLYDFTRVSLANIPLNEVPKLFTDCNFSIGYLTRGLTEYFARVGWSKILGNNFGGGFLNDLMGNALGDLVNDQGFMQSLHKSLAATICPKLGSVGKQLAQKALGGGGAGGAGGLDKPNALPSRSSNAQRANFGSRRTALQAKG